MRKRLMTTSQDRATDAVAWLDLDRLAEVELSSEDPAYPIESALLPGRGPGWRAATPGPQTIRLHFDEPQDLRTIRLEFREAAVERTQEYAVRWSRDGGRAYAEIVRQQWNFSPGGSTEQVSEHRVELTGVTVLALDLVPDIGGGDALASLAKLQLA